MISRFKTAYIRLLHSIRLDSTTKKSLYVSLGLSLKQKQQQMTIVHTQNNNNKNDNLLNNF